MSQKVKTICRLLIAVDDEVLLVQRSDKASLRPGEWELPGGRLDEGEGLLEAALREALEETGLELDSAEYLDAVAGEDPHTEFIIIFYSKRLKKRPKINLSSEHQSYQWIKKNELDSYDMHYTNWDELNRWFHPDGKTLKTIDNRKNVENRIAAEGGAVIYSDGGSRGNPGPSATGYVIYDQDENELARGGTYIGIATNNQAEYLAVKEGLVKAKELGLKNVDYYMDSMLVVKQMSGEYKIKNKDLWPIHQSIKDLSREFDNVSFTHVRREKNKVADSIVNEVLDDHQN